MEDIGQCSDAERRWVEQRIIEIIQQAELDADRVADFLDARGVPRSSEDDSPATPDEAEAASAILLNLAAAIRLASWERAGLTPYLPAELPSSDAALTALDQCSPPTSVSRLVFQTLLERFIQGGQSALGTDIIMASPTSTDLLDELAALLLGASQKDAEENEGK